MIIIIYATSLFWKFCCIIGFSLTFTIVDYCSNISTTSLVMFPHLSWTFTSSSPIFIYFFFSFLLFSISTGLCVDHRNDLNYVSFIPFWQIVYENGLISSYPCNNLLISGTHDKFKLVYISIQTTLTFYIILCFHLIFSLTVVCPHNIPVVYSTYQQ